MKLKKIIALFCVMLILTYATPCIIQAAVDTTIEYNIPSELSSSEKTTVNNYKKAFEELPDFLKYHITSVDFVRAPKESFLGRCMWSKGKVVGGVWKCPIEINLSKQTSNYKYVATHEAAHAFDTANTRYSGTSGWKNFTDKY